MEGGVIALKRPLVDPLENDVIALGKKIHPLESGVVVLGRLSLSLRNWSYCTREILNQSFP
jgi:hypothetical protein